MNLFENLQTFFLTKKEDALDTKNALQSPVAPNTTDGDVAIVGGIQSVNDNINTQKTNDKELIELYRSISHIPEVNEAIEEIVNEMVAIDCEGEVVTLNLEDTDLSAKVKEKITEEFHDLLNVLDFEQRGHDLIRRWYIDGRLAAHKIIDKSRPKDGIKEIRYINPASIEKVIEYKKVKEGNIELFQTTKEYFKYNPTNKTNTISLSGKDNGSSANIGSNFWATQNSSLYGSNQIIALSPDAVAFVTSGLYDEDFGSVLSYLHSAIKVANQLSTMEDSLVIYRLSRAPERRIFYLDVGNLPKNKAEEYVTGMMTKFKNTLSYDTTTGVIKDNRRFMSMMEDFWIPRRENGRSTEVTTLPGGQSLGQLDDVQYFINKLYKSLKIPSSRFSSEQPMMAGIGRSSEITRDEIRFQKFVDRLRSRFSLFFDDLLGTQLILKGIVSKEEWAEIKSNITYEWARDNFASEMKDQEILRERFTTVQLAEPYIGKFVTREFVLKDIMRVKDSDYDELIKDIEAEKEEQSDQEYDDAIQQNNLAADKLDKTMQIQQKYDKDEE